MPGTERINIRATQEQVDLLKLAAESSKVSLTAFMVAAAEQLARNLINEKPISYTKRDGRSKEIEALRSTTLKIPGLASE